MKVSKHLHSCLLIEDTNTTFLVDPGIFTYQENALDITKLQKLDYILITHNHPDHCHPMFIKEILAKFPQAAIITNESVATLLKNEGISSSTTGTSTIIMEEVTHEKLWDVEPPPNTIFHIANRLTHPGDSFHFPVTKDILALPLQAPWGSTIEAVNLALRLQPKIILPIHDWMWKDGVRQMMYQRLQGFFKEKGIDFKPLETNEVVEI